MPWSQKTLTVLAWLVPGLVAVGALVGLTVHVSLPDGHPPLSAYVFAPTVLLALVLSPLAIWAAIALVGRVATGSPERFRAWIVALLNVAILLVFLAIWRAG